MINTRSAYVEGGMASPRSKYTAFVAVKVAEDQRELMEQRAREYGCSTSHLVRESLRAAMPVLFPPLPARGPLTLDMLREGATNERAAGD
jgi:hypothetical protein